MYERGNLFLEYERLIQGKDDITWMSEERIEEISKMDVKDRTFTAKSGSVTLPAHNELKIMGKADEEVRYAKAQFIVEKIWK